MKTRLLCALAVCAIVTSGGSSFATTTRCDTARRTETYYDSSGTRHTRYTDHNTPGENDQHLGTPEDAIVKDGNGRYGLVTNDAWVEALGGNGYGSGQTDDPAHRAAEGGLVQGDVHPTESAAAPDVNFGVNAFGPLDETDNAHFFDTGAGACVDADGTVVSTGEIYAPTSSLPHP